MHGISKKNDKELYLKFTFLGSLSKGYKMQGFHAGYQPFDKKEGQYIEYKENIQVEI